jgi:acetyl-CoA carboxylase biotin carboxyl carrier protein
MMDLDFVQSLIKALDESGLDTVEIERGATRIRLSKTPSSVAAAALAALAPSPVALAAPAPPAQEVNVPSDAPASGDSGLAEITSPMVGTFYRAPAPDARSYIEMDANVSPGDTLCIIEAMKLMNELECEVTGVIREICVENGDPIEYGQVLFRVSPS